MSHNFPELEFNRIYVCTSCLEEVHLADTQEGHTACCNAGYTEDSLRTKVDFLGWVEETYTPHVESSLEELTAIRNHVRSMSPDSKKRRKAYPRVENNWPGRLSTATTKKAMRQEGRAKSEKGPPPIKVRNQMVDIMSDTKGWVVVISGKFSYTVHGKDRVEARRRARAWLRSQGSTITTASSVIEEQNKTLITM